MLREVLFIATRPISLLALNFGLMLLPLSAAAGNSSPLDLARSIDCDAVNNRSFSVELDGMARTTRVITLRAGETIDFSFETTAGPFGSLTLVSGAGSPRPLLAGPTGTTVRFVAPARGAFGFEFATEGETDAAFTVACSPAQSAQNGASRIGSFASRRAAKLLAETPNLRMLPELEIPAGSIDPETWDLLQDSRLATFNQAGARRTPPTESYSRIRPPDGFDVWLQAEDKRYSFGQPIKARRDGDAAALSGAGLNYKLLPKIMVGALVQFDQQRDQITGAPLSLSDRGWMAGPVTSMHLMPGISLDARAAWGESEPAAPFSAASGLGADRRLVNARLANTQTFGHWRFSPSVAVNYSEQTQHIANPATDGGLVQQTFGSGRVDIRPELSYRLNVDGSTFVEPKAAISSFWDIDGLSSLTPGSAEQALRIKAEAGVTVGTTTGTKLQATAGVEEGNAGAEDIWSGRLQLSVPLK